MRRSDSFTFEHAGRSDHHILGTAGAFGLALAACAAWLWASFLHKVELRHSKPGRLVYLASVFGRLVYLASVCGLTQDTVPPGRRSP